MFVRDGFLPTFRNIRSRSSETILMVIFGHRKTQGVNLTAQFESCLRLSDKNQC